MEQLLFQFHLFYQSMKLHKNPRSTYPKAVYLNHSR